MIDLGTVSLVVCEENRNLFGEVFTDPALIAEMLRGVVWSDPGVRFLDPTCGHGYFLFVIYDLLMGNGQKYAGYEAEIGLSLAIPDEAERERHIVENMLWGTDLQQSSVDFCRRLFKHGEYKTNFFCADFLNWEFDGEFDYVVGNPPFESNQDGKRKAKNHNLWRPIILKSYSMLAAGGGMAFVCPQSWMSWSKANSEMVDIFAHNDVHALNIGECRRHFKGIGSSFSYFFVRRTKTADYATSIVCEWKGKVHRTSAVLSGERFFPLLMTQTTLSIIRKLLGSGLPAYDVRFDSSLHAYTKKSLLSKTRDAAHPNKVWHTPNQVLWSSVPHPTQNSAKVFIPISTYYEKMHVDVAGNTQGFGYLLCDGIEEAREEMRTLNLKIYRFFVQVTRWSNWNSPDVLRSLPRLEPGTLWDDAKAYARLGLTQEEIDLVEELIS